MGFSRRLFMKGAAAAPVAANRIAQGVLTGGEAPAPVPTIMSNQASVFQGPSPFPTRSPHEVLRIAHKLGLVDRATLRATLAMSGVDLSPYADPYVLTLEGYRSLSPVAKARLQKEHAAERRLDLMLAGGTSEDGTVWGLAAKLAKVIP